MRAERSHYLSTWRDGCRRVVGGRDFDARMRGAKFPLRLNEQSLQPLRTDDFGARRRRHDGDTLVLEKEEEVAI